MIYVLHKWAHHDNALRFYLTKYTRSVFEEPLSTYRILWNKHNRACDCPSHKQPCKHIDLIQRWLEHARKNDVTVEEVVYDDMDDTFTASPLIELTAEDIVERANKMLGLNK